MRRPPSEIYIFPGHMCLVLYASYYLFSLLPDTVKHRQFLGVIAAWTKSTTFAKLVPCLKLLLQPIKFDLGSGAGEIITVNAACQPTLGVRENTRARRALG